MLENQIIIVRDKRGRFLPTLDRETLTEMLNLPNDTSINKCIKVAINTMKYNANMKYNIRAMCNLKEDAPTGVINRRMQQLLRKNK